MHLDKDFLSYLERKIGHDCKITISAAEIPGLKLTATSRENETGNRVYWSRVFSVNELQQHRTPLVMFDGFAFEAKAQLDAILVKNKP